MKKILLLICFCFSVLMYSQSNDEIASIYIKRAEKKHKEQKTSEAVKDYTKAMKYIDISKSTDISVPKLGMVLFAEIEDFVQAKKYSKDYFRLVSDKTSDEYLNMLELYVDIVDKLEESGNNQVANNTSNSSYNTAPKTNPGNNTTVTSTSSQPKTANQVVKTPSNDNTSSSPSSTATTNNTIAYNNTAATTAAKPGNKITYYSTPATNTSSIPSRSSNSEPVEVVSERIKTSYTPRKEGGYTQLELAEDRAYPSTIVADKTYPFNANGIAVFEKSGKLGLINDQGRVFLYPEEYKDFVEYDGYIILKNQKENATKLYCFNSNINFGFILPGVREYNSLSSTYGKVMKPRGNGILVTYPNNSLDVLKFDLNRGEYIPKSKPLELIKDLETISDYDIEYKIDEYKDILEVKMGEDWVVLGSSLGGGIYPLFVKETYSVYGYAFNKNEGEAEKRVMRYLGSYYDGKIQASSSNESWWLDKSSKAIKSEEIIEEKYKGDSEIVEVSAGTYKVQQVVGKQ